MSSSAADSKQKKQKTDSESPDFEAKFEEIKRKHEQELEEIKRKLEEEVEEIKRELEETEGKLEETEGKLEGEVEAHKGTKRKLEERSLYAAVYGNKIPPIENHGSNSAHWYPKNHETAAATFDVLTQFVPNDIIKMSESPTGNITEWLKDSHSFLMAYVQDQKQKQQNALNISNEADIQALVYWAMLDATNLSRKLLADVAESKMNKTEDDIPDLAVQREMSIFSNVVDHTVIYDRRSKKPIFSIESKKLFNNTIRNGKENRVFGQSYDQLRSMKAKGHPTPFAAITSFDVTYIACLPDEEMYKESLDSHRSHDSKRLERILSRFYRKKSPVLTQSPPKTESPPALITESHTQLVPQFKADSGRKISITGNFESKDLVCLFTNVILCAIDATFTPTLIQKFGIGQQIAVDAIQMDETSYQWGVLTATIQGPLKNGNDKSLYLLDFLGAGATSVVYRAVTFKGDEFVVKIIVDTKDGDVDSNKETNGDFHQGPAKFKEISGKMVNAEIAAYKAVYGDTLEGYVWQQKLNGLDCIVMPFFEPIPKEKRKEALESIGAALGKFRNAKMMFKECDQLWRHVGQFKGQTFLYDLGDLDCNLTEELLDDRIDQHLNHLNERAEIQDDPSTSMREM